MISSQEIAQPVREPQLAGLPGNQPGAARGTLPDQPKRPQRSGWHRWGGRFGLRFAIYGSLLAGMFPAIWPAWDQSIATWFFTTGRGFPLQDSSLVQFVYLGIPWLSRAAVVLLLIGIVVSWRLRQRRWLQGFACALLALAIGPGLLINGLLKEQVGRARPEQVSQFGGTRVFAGALRPSDQCQHNCAFVSGHAAVGFWFAVGYAVSRRRQRTWLGVATLAGAVVGLARMAAGGHWLSDVIFSMSFTLMGVGLAYWLAYRPGLRWRLAKARWRNRRNRRN